MKHPLLQLLIIFFTILLLPLTLKASSDDTNQTLEPWSSDATNTIVNVDGGDGTSADSPIKIATAGELAYLAKQTNVGGQELQLTNGSSLAGKKNFKDVYFALSEDIDLLDRPWTPIGNTTDNKFSGFFNGNDHVITNLQIENTEQSKDYAGIFGRIELATIQNLEVTLEKDIDLEKGGVGFVGVIAGYANQSTIEGCTVKGSVFICKTTASQLCMGGIVGQTDNGCTIKKCTGEIGVKGYKDNASALYCGGIAGGTLKTKIDDCHFKGAVDAIDKRTDTTPSSGAGGIAGNCSGAAIGAPSGVGEVSNCTTEVTITEGAYTGGIVGYAGIAKIKDCQVNKVKISTGSNAGGIVGFLSEGNITNCQTNSGQIQTSVVDSDAGGICGWFKYDGIIENCTNEVSVSSTNCAGGIVGYKYANYSLEILKCKSNGNISALFAGGIGGYLGLKTVVEECFSSGYITSNIKGAQVGGIVGCIMSMEVKNCYSTATIKGGENAICGGIVGYGAVYSSSSSPVIQKCYSTGKIQSGYVASGIGHLVNGEIKNCLALNTAGIGEDENEGNSTQSRAVASIKGRISGDAGSSSFSSNFSSSLIPGDWETNATQNEINGADLTEENFNSKTGNALDGWENALWNNLDDEFIPTLKVFSDAQVEQPVDKVPKKNFYPYDVTISFEQPEHGAIKVSYTDANGITQSVTAESPIPGGSELTIIAEPEEGYELASLKVDGTDFTSGTTVQITQDITIEATFTLQCFAVVFDSPNDGEIKISYTKESVEQVVHSGDKVPYGSELTITANATTEGYCLKSLLINETAFTSGGIHKVTEEIRIKALFEMQSFTVQIAKPIHGSIRVVYDRNGVPELVTSGDQFPYGTKLSFYAYPADKYGLETLKVNNTALTSGSSLILTEDIQVVATFYRIPDPIPPYVPTIYYDVVIPTVKGATTNPVAGTYQVKEGLEFHFQLTLENDYDQSKPVVSTQSKEIITPDEKGFYTIKNVDRNIIFRIDSIVKNSNTVGIDPITSTDRLRVWKAGNILYVKAPAGSLVQIFSMKGKLLKSYHATGNASTFWFPSGFYIIRSGKVQLKVGI